MQLETDRPGLRAAGFSWIFRHEVAIQADADHIVAGFDVERVPVEIALEAGLGFGEQVDAAGTVFVAVIGDLNLVADVGGGALGIVLGALSVAGTRGITDGDAAVAAPAQPELDVEIVLAEVLFGVEPALMFG